MRTKEITHEHWQSFFNDFTELHRNEHVNVESMKDGIFDPKSHLCDVPLIGILPAYPKVGEAKCIEVIARNSSGRHATHSIPNPSRVRMAEENGHAVAVQIESADGLITMIRFEPSYENMPQGFTIG